MRKAIFVFGSFVAGSSYSDRARSDPAIEGSSLCEP
jgi:hypothetical protein